MAITNHERVGKALELLKNGLILFVERELAAHYGKYWLTKVTEHWPRDLSWPEDQEKPHFDVAAILRLLWEQWNPRIHPLNHPAQPSQSVSTAAWNWMQPA